MEVVVVLCVYLLGDDVFVNKFECFQMGVVVWILEWNEFDLSFYEYVFIKVFDLELQKMVGELLGRWWLLFSFIGVGNDVSEMFGRMW